MKQTRVLVASVVWPAMAALATAQQQGPVTPTPPARTTGETKPAPATAHPDVLPAPVEEIIRRFAAKEAVFKQAREEYGYTQTFRLHEYDAASVAGGQYQLTSEIAFLPDGRRYEQITYAPPPTLRMISISPEDLQDLQNIQPFVLTTADLPKYLVEYQGRDKVDEIITYVFRIHPRRMEPGQRYFEGTIWVDDQDLQIVKTHGKAVPDIHKGNQENLFPTFETYRENIDGQYWFPTYTRADDVLHFKRGDVRVVVTIRYKNYKRRVVQTRIVGAEPVTPQPAKPPPPPRN